MTHTDEFIGRILNDTGALCRDLLGYNYDEDAGGHHVNIGKGGIVDHGKTQEIVELIDNTSLRFKFVMAPRESRKSTIAQGYCVRRILQNPNIRIFYVGRTDAIVKGKALAIRAQLERQEITDLFGKQQGDKWEETSFTVATRTHHGLMDPTFTAFSQDSLPTGGRCNVLLLDDFIDHTNVTTAEQNKKSKERWKLLQPFIARGAEVVIFCTLWADDDLNSELRGLKLFSPPSGGQVVCGTGVRVLSSPMGELDLEVVETGLTFPHLTRDYLYEKLQSMALAGNYRQFVLQYLNESVGSAGTSFYRHYFRPLRWGEDMEQLSGYLLTDTAIGETDSSCYSVVAYVGLDAADNIYLLDLEVGNWDPTEFRERFFAVLERWQGKVNHCGECWEAVALATAYRDAIEQDSRSRKTKLRTIEMPRTARSHKPDRIKRLVHPMSSKKFYVVDTMPRTFRDVTGEKVLWDPIGFYDGASKTFQPGGELVEEFVKESTKKDIPDTLAMILEWTSDKRHPKRFCSYKPWHPRPRSVGLTEQRSAAYHRERYGQAADATDWWDRTLREQGF